MTAQSLESIPYGVLLEICAHLDVQTLIALSETSRAFFAISRSFKSYWLPSVLASELILPLPSHLPLPSFTASELRTACLKAVYRDANFGRSSPCLRSSTHITWPYEPPSPGLQSNTIDETSEEAIWMHLAHPNGEWLFLVSSNNVLRILNLRRGVLVWEEQYADVLPEDHMRTRVAFAVDFLGDVKARMAMVVSDHRESSDSPEDDDDDDDDDGSDGEWTPKEESHSLQVLEVLLYPDAAKAEANVLVRQTLDFMPVYLDVAGEYVALVEEVPGVHHRYDAGSVHLLQWTTKTFIELPQVSMFQSYFFSLGLQDEKVIVLQVVACPTGKATEDRNRSDSNTKAAEIRDSGSNKDGYTLAASIPLLPPSSPDNATLTPQYTEICHVYKGPVANAVRIWVREVMNACWSVFTLTGDFGQPPRDWFKQYQPLDADLPIGELGGIEKKRVWDKPGSIHWTTPNAPGRRFIWWLGEVMPNQTEEGDPEWEDHVTKRLRIYSGQLYRLPLPEVVEKTMGRVPENHHVESILEQMGVQEMEVPDGLQIHWDDETVYAQALEEWSGTILLILTNGDIWVLRYGRP